MVRDLMDSYERAFNALREMFGDTTYTPEEAAARLKGLRIEIDESLGLLSEDGVDVSRVAPADPPEV